MKAKARPFSKGEPEIVSVKPKKIFGDFRQDMFYVVKHTITTHYRAILFLHLFGVHLQPMYKTFGGPNNYLFFS
jgi:hypothetical protein